MTVWPNGTKTKPYVSSGFGPRNLANPNASKFHRGMDTVGFSTVRAVEDGVVRVVGTPGGWSGGGTQVWIQHDGFFSRSLHLASYSVYVGQEVKAGDPIGVMGRTGAIDIHLHLEISPGKVHYSNTGQVDPVPFITNLISSPASGGGLAEGDDMPLDDKDRLFLIQLGADIVAQTNAQVQGVKADVATVHNTVISGNQSVIDAAHAIRADINYIHTLSPYSLKAILEASRGGEIKLTDAQVKAIGGQLAASAVAGIDAALRDDFEGVKTQLLAQLPKATIAALKAAL